MKSQAFQLGNKEPFKLTPNSAKKLIEAIIETESDIITIYKDTTCPPTHVICRFNVKGDKNKQKFENILGRYLEDIPEVGW